MLIFEHWTSIPYLNILRLDFKAFLSEKNHQKNQMIFELKNSQMKKSKTLIYLFYYSTWVFKICENNLDIYNHLKSYNILFKLQKNCEIFGDNAWNFWLKEKIFFSPRSNYSKEAYKLKNIIKIRLQFHLNFYFYKF